MIYTTITPEEFGDWVNLCGGGFEMAPDEFYDHFVNDPDADYNGVFVAIDDSVGHGGGDLRYEGRGNQGSRRVVSNHGLLGGFGVEWI